MKGEPYACDLAHPWPCQIAPSWPVRHACVSLPAAAGVSQVQISAWRPAQPHGLSPPGLPGTDVGAVAGMLPLLAEAASHI